MPRAPVDLPSSPIRISSRHIFTSIVLFSGSGCNNCRTECNNITGYCDGYCENGYYGPDCNSTCPVNCYSRVKETQENVPFVRIRITVQFVRIIVPLDVVISTATKLATVLVVKIHTMENNVKTIAL